MKGVGTVKRKTPYSGASRTGDADVFIGVRITLPIKDPMLPMSNEYRITIASQARNPVKYNEAPLLNLA